MVEKIKSRVIDEAKYIIENGETIRKVAKEFKVSKSTVHKDLRVRLKEYDKDLYEKVSVILEKNLAERHIRGGEVTKERYKKKE